MHFDCSSTELIPQSFFHRSNQEKTFLLNMNCIFALILLVLAALVGADEGAVVSSPLNGVEGSGTVHTWEEYIALQNDLHIIIAYFYSNANCKNCDAFSKQWGTLQEKIKHVKFATILVDTEEGKDIALRTGAVDGEHGGIPHVRLMYSKHDYIALMDGIVLSDDRLVKNINRELDGYEKGESGVYLKTNTPEEL